METNKLITLENRAKDLIKYHCPDYRFQYDRAKRRYGYCDWINKTISVSKTIAELNSIEESLNTVLHEIAHALVPKEGHNKVWKAVCKEIGGDGIARYTIGNIVVPTKPWKLFRKVDTSFTGVTRFRRTRLKEDSAYFWAK